MAEPISDKVARRAEIRQALEWWQAGEITARRAQEVTGADDVLELYAAAAAYGVPIRQGLLPREARAAEAATAMIRRHMGGEP